MLNRSTTTAVRGVLLAALAGSLAIAPAAAQAPHPSISLTPSQFPGVLSDGVRIGPISLTNGTTVHYRVRAFPVLLGQHRDGGLFVRDDAASRARAARLVAVQTRRFDFPRGAARSVLARIRRIPRSRSLYGGVLFQATPRGKQSGQITNVLRLNASLLLDPPPALRRLSFEADEGVRAEPGGRRRLQLLVPVKNRGNVYRGAAGELVVRDSSGAVVTRAVLRRRRILPGATVELPATVDKLLPAGSYQLSAKIRGGRRPLEVVGRMRLFGANRLRVRAAKLIDVPAPTAYRGRPVDLDAFFRNTGNVPYAPAAQVQVRPLVRGQRRAVALTKTMDVDRTSPGKRGRTHTELKLPGSAPAYELTVRLREGARELDTRTIAVTPTKRPSLSARAKDFVTGHALGLLGGLLAVFVIGLILGVRYIRRLKAAGASRL